MSHLPILPILIPLTAAAILLTIHGVGIATKRIVGMLSLLLVIVVAVIMLSEARQGIITVYHLGNWPAPYGIVLMQDRLSALMVALTAALALPVMLLAQAGWDSLGRHFHTFLQLQLAGLNGAFLTGDLFNLFVFFEILLLASYALLVHGGGLERTRAGLAYVILNLAGSALFLIALGLIYGTLGTLNMADLIEVLPNVPIANQPVARTALALIILVFLLKAALVPLGFWLPHVYAAAIGPVAVLFVIMTKVGIYALLRLSTIGLSGASFTDDLLQPWLAWLSIATIILGTIGALAASRLTVVVANFVLISSGTLLLGVAAATPEAIAAMLTYLVHTVVWTAALFLLADAISHERGAAADTIEKGPRLQSFVGLGAAYLIVAVAVSGAPPLSGFIAKLMILQSLRDTASWISAWSVLLISGFITALVLARAASAYFWEPGKEAEDTAAETMRLHMTSPRRALWMTVIAALMLVPFAPTIAGYTSATADQILQRGEYRAAVIGRQTKVDRERRP